MLGYRAESGFDKLDVHIFERRRDAEASLVLEIPSSSHSNSSQVAEPRFRAERTVCPANTP